MACSLLCRCGDGMFVVSFYPSNNVMIQTQFLSRSIVVLLVRCGENANYFQGEIFIFNNGGTKWT